MSENKPKPARGSNPELQPHRPPQFTEERPAYRERLDDQLMEYLAAQQEERAAGNTVGNLRNDVLNVKMELHAIRNETGETNAELKLVRLRLDRHGRDIRDLKATVYHKDPDEMDTGSYQVADLRKHLAEKEAELKERRDEQKSETVWWKRQKIQWAAAALGACAALSVGSLGTVLWFLLTHNVK